MMKGKQVLLTGGTGGLGLGVTPTVVASGARIVIPYLSENGVLQLKKRLSAAQFEQITFVKTDLNDESALPVYGAI